MQDIAKRTGCEDATCSDDRSRGQHGTDGGTGVCWFMDSNDSLHPLIYIYIYIVLSIVIDTMLRSDFTTC